jgi:hypothetical protein
VPGGDDDEAAIATVVPHGDEHLVLQRVPQEADGDPVRLAAREFPVAALRSGVLSFGHRVLLEVTERACARKELSRVVGAPQDDPQSLAGGVSCRSSAPVFDCRASGV